MCLFLEVLFDFRGCVCWFLGSFVCFWGFSSVGFLEVSVPVQVFTVFGGFVCVWRFCFGGSCLSSTKRPGSIFDEF